MQKNNSSLREMSRKHQQRQFEIGLLWGFILGATMGVIIMLVGVCL